MFSAHPDMHKQNNVEKFFDIKKIIAEKSPKTAKLLPGFILRYLRKILHEDSINEFISSHRDVYGLCFAKAVLKHFGAKLVVHGLDNLETDERLLIASNHPLGGLDGVGLMVCVGLKKPDLLFPVIDILLYLPNLRDLFIPLNKYGKHPKDAIKLLDEAMASEKTILYFPAGLVSRLKNGKIADLEWKKTFVTKSKKFNRKIVPVFIKGRNSNFFYNFARLRKILGIKTNIEILYLIDEMYKQFNNEMNIFIGKPLLWEEMPGNMTDEHLAGHIRTLVYKLPFSDAFTDERKLIVEYS